MVVQFEPIGRRQRGRRGALNFDYGVVGRQNGKSFMKAKQREPEKNVKKDKKALSPQQRTQRCDLKKRKHLEFNSNHTNTIQYNTIQYL
ncbi:hypothetical protein RJT34_10010 [Clitoria ternatea]|uniref:Uncharacterized protein n=1 Tax=Clitoria ternatea TaxID=43366 RepID=A0AAN9PUY8_CLITE